MTLRLVTEARPISWSRLSQAEKQKLLHANEWIRAVQEDAKSEKPTAQHIDSRRSGRVLFIDGVRGAGKTSMLLTLLQLWKREQEAKEFVVPTDELHVFLPVLDFDPLPRGMPLQGWLLEPWRREAENLDKEGKGSPGPIDLTEKWADLFERAVIGWTHAHVEGQGVVEKALAYHEQASGWLETQQKWRQFVGTMVCRRFGCKKENEKCQHAHPFVFVVAIDDVDLQVEQLPQLLHAIRLLDHPNVAYVLTGNYDHLKFVLGLDYIRRHEHRAPSHRHSEHGVDDKLWEDIKKHSFTLRDAFLEKALPKSAMVTLPHLTFAEVLNFSADERKSVEKTVRGTLHASTLNVLLQSELESESVKARDLPIITARQAQHATDRHLLHLESPESKAEVVHLETPESKAEAEKIAATHKFIADLCGTEVESEKRKALKAPTKFTIRGKLTTQLGPTLRVWEGDEFKLTLAAQPSFVFFPDFDDTNAVVKEGAHRALLVQLLVDKEDVVAHGLEWAPDAGIVTTQVTWDPQSPKVDRKAIFHWPWLQPPSAAEVLELRKLSGEMSSAAVGNSLSDSKDKMLEVWLLKNIDWRRNAPLLNGVNPAAGAKQIAALEASTDAQIADAHPSGTLDKFQKDLESLWATGIDAIQVEIKRWGCELYVMTAPYFGLPKDLAVKLRAVIKHVLKDTPTPEELSVEQNRMVRNAIIKVRAENLDAPELNALTQRFLEERKRRLSGKEELALWIQPLYKTPAGKASGRKTSGRKTPAGKTPAHNRPGAPNKSAKK